MNEQELEIECEVESLGQPQTVGEMRQLLERFKDDEPFGFRNQPMQTLKFVKFNDDQSSVVFD